jgi:hypothetical protein
VFLGKMIIETTECKRCNENATKKSSSSKKTAFAYLHFKNDYAIRKQTAGKKLLKLSLSRKKLKDSMGFYFLSLREKESFFLAEDYFLIIFLVVIFPFSSVIFAK